MFEEYFSYWAHHCHINLSRANFTTGPEGTISIIPSTGMINQLCYSADLDDVRSGEYNTAAVDGVTF